MKFIFDGWSGNRIGEIRDQRTVKRQLNFKGEALRWVWNEGCNSREDWKVLDTETGGKCGGSFLHLQFG